MRFVQHWLRFPEADRDTYFRLLSKYYHGVRATVTIDEKVAMATVLTPQNLDLIPRGETYHVQTERFWRGRTLLSALPKCERPLDGDYSETARVIDDLIRDRLDNGTNEVELRREFKHPRTMQELRLAIRQLQTEHITRMLEGPNWILLIIGEDTPILVGTRQVKDGILPDFHIMSGFCDDESFPEWHAAQWNRTYFRPWSRRLDKNNGASWDEPILSPRGGEPSCGCLIL